MRAGRRGSGWLMAGAVCGLVACSSSGMVLESRRGDPAPPGDAGPASSTGDAGALTGVDSEALRSGSRVHVSAYASGGNFLSVRAAHDTLHDVDCEIDVAEDGVPRCVPNGSPGEASGFQTSVVFLDADCTVPAISVQSFGCGSTPPSAVMPFVAYQSGKACPKPVVHVVSPGA